MPLVLPSGRVLVRARPPMELFSSAQLAHRQRLWDRPPMQTSYQGPVPSGFYYTGASSADGCGYRIEFQDDGMYTRWRGSWWKLEGPSPMMTNYDPVVHSWTREQERSADSSAARQTVSSRAQDQPPVQTSYVGPFWGWIDFLRVLVLPTGVFSH